MSKRGAHVAYGYAGFCIAWGIAMIFITTTRLGLGTASFCMAAGLVLACTVFMHRRR